MLRVGSVPYLVARPLDLGLEAEPGIELLRDVPSRLVAMLRAGEIDVALVSSIELFRRPGYRFLERVGVAGKGTVSSVQVFLRRPLAEVRSVALDPASRAAAALSQVVWPGDAARGRPRFVEVSAGRDPRDAEADAWLRIGDAALREHHAAGSPPVFNPSRAWTESTGLPFVFAVWIVRPGVDVEPWTAAFARSRTAGAQRVGELAREAARAWGLSEEITRHYLAEECLYEPDVPLREIVLAFRDRAAELGLCDGALAPEALALPAPHATG